MNAKLYRTMKDESGITALETAIILIAFVVVAAIFAFTVLTPARSSPNAVKKPHTPACKKFAGRWNSRVA